LSVHIKSIIRLDSRASYSKPEAKSRLFLRSLYIAEDMKKGDVLNEQNLRIVRPGLGFAPKYSDVLLGRKVNKDVNKRDSGELGVNSLNNRGTQ
jgi:sialic acid synthase SpsE